MIMDDGGPPSPGGWGVGEGDLLHDHLVMITESMIICPCRLPYSPLVMIIPDMAVMHGST